MPSLNVLDTESALKLLQVFKAIREWQPSQEMHEISNPKVPRLSPAKPPLDRPWPTANIGPLHPLDNPIA